MTPSEENVTTTSEPEMIEAQPGQPSPDEFHPHLGRGRRTAVLVAAAALAALAFLIYSGIHSRAAAESRLKERTEEAAIPTVSVVFPRKVAPTREMAFPAKTRRSTTTRSMTQPGDILIAGYSTMVRMSRSEEHT